MTQTERAIAKLYYRLVYERKIMTLDAVPEVYRAVLEEYRREVES